MQEVIENIKRVFKQYKTDEIRSIDKLPQAGSDRHYFRIHCDQSSFIATYGVNIPENEVFVYFTDHFKKKKLTVPQIFFVSDDSLVYIQEDLGDVSLLDELELKGHSEQLYGLYKKSLFELALLQVKGDNGLDYDRCLTNTAFGKQAIMADLLYFKYYFLDALRKPYDKQKLMNDFEVLSNHLSHTEYKYFMFRDFQSRNIMVKDDEVFFIDYQGGMKGAPQYDVASLLWQAKANLPAEWKQKLLDEYINGFEEAIGAQVDRHVFKSQYNGYVLIRLLQVLGAYGFRGLFERKAHFLTSIPLALQNLRAFLYDHALDLPLVEFTKILEICTCDEVISDFTPVKATDETPLVVTLNSFSYKRGIPVDETINGGGFVFDMRGILNPGRFEEYKRMSGLDKPVKDFLEQQTKMPDYLNGVYSLVDISVTDYINRGFESLMVNFGCTGGQHRSVYACEALARHLRNKFNVKIKILHNNKDNWVV